MLLSRDSSHGRSDIFDRAVPGLPETLRIRVQTGPAINGTDLRDVTATGAFTLLNPKMWLITPIAFEVQE